MSSSLFQEMEEFTLFDGLVPSSLLADYSPAVDDQLDAGILFPGDSLVKKDVGPEDLFEDLLSNGSLEDPFSQEWMETVDLSSILEEEKPAEKITVENVPSKASNSSRLLEELLTQPIKIKISPTVSQNVKLDTCNKNTDSDSLNVIQNLEIVSSSQNILEQAVVNVGGLSAFDLTQELQDLYNDSISSDNIENTSSEISLMDTGSEFLIGSPLSTDDIDSILSGSEPASPSNSTQDDPDYTPSVNQERKSKRQSKSNKSRSAPYNIDKPVEKLDRKERKRIQNRNAAIRYREKKRAERGNIHNEEDELVSKNKELKSKVEGLTNEISYMKNLLTEVCEARGLKIRFQ